MTKSRLRPYGLTPLLLLLLALAACGRWGGTADSRTRTAVSGRLEAGLRVLTFDPVATDQRFTVYRGDYVRPELSTGGAFALEIPALEVSRSFPGGPDEQPYFKVPEAGSFEFRLGAASGVIEAIEFSAAQYREADAREASDLIASMNPLILDVRTPREFAAGHLADAVLIPVQELQRRLGELSSRRQDPVLVYCATGNRSTVAAKLLVDAGFVQVVNMRRGIAEWNSNGFPTVK